MSELPVLMCWYCGAPFRWSGLGRTARACSTRCRVARHRARAAGQCDAPALHTHGYPHACTAQPQPKE